MAASSALALAAILLLLPGAGGFSQSVSHEVAVADGRKILYQGETFTLKGVNWNPVPPGSSKAEFRGFVEADSDLMAAAGINAVRTYSPINDTEVLDVLWKKGIFLLNTVYTDADDDVSMIEATINAVKGHPAILMWIVGNEWNYNMMYSSLKFSQVRKRIKAVSERIKELDPDHLVGTVHGMIPADEVVQEMTAIDVWGLTAYNGLSIADIYPIWGRLSRDPFKPRPFFVAEFGADAYNSDEKAVDEDAQAKATRALAKEIADNSVLTEGGVCSGGLVFELADEWWKDGKGSKSTQDTGGSAPGGGPYPDGIFNEEYWGLVQIDGTLRKAYTAYAEADMPMGWAPESVARPSLADVGHGRRGAACGFNPNCRSQGLLGDCCPGSDGSSHRCCSGENANATESTKGKNAHGDKTKASTTTTAAPTISPATTQISTAATSAATTGAPAVTAPAADSSTAAASASGVETVTDEMRWPASRMVASLSIGSPPQEIRCLLDSVSADIWIPSLQCDGCGSELTFDCSQSLSCEQDASLPQVTVPLDEDDSGLPGLVVSGGQSSDAVALGGHGFAGQPFVLLGQAPTSQQPRLWDGVCGLGWRSQARTSWPLFEALGKEGHASQLGVVPASGPGTAAWLRVGGVPFEAMEPGTLAWASVESGGEGGPDQWVIAGTLTSHSQRRPRDVRLLIDLSSDQALLVPSAGLFKDFVRSLMPKDSFDGVAAGKCDLDMRKRSPVTCHCGLVDELSTHVAPLTVVLGGKPFTLPVAKMLVPSAEHSELCVLRVRPHASSPSAEPEAFFKLHMADLFGVGAPLVLPARRLAGSAAVEWILGGAFLENLVLVFDYDDAQVGFAELKRGYEEPRAVLVGLDANQEPQTDQAEAGLGAGVGAAQILIAVLIVVFGIAICVPTALAHPEALSGLRLQAKRLLQGDSEDKSDFELAASVESAPETADESPRVRKGRNQTSGQSQTPRRGDARDAS